LPRACSRAARPPRSPRTSSPTGCPEAKRRRGQRPSSAPPRPPRSPSRRPPRRSGSRRLRRRARCCAARRWPAHKRARGETPLPGPHIVRRDGEALVARALPWTASMPRRRGTRRGWRLAASRRRRARAASDEAEALSVPVGACPGRVSTTCRGQDEAASGESTRKDDGAGACRLVERAIEHCRYVLARREREVDI